MNEKKEIVVTGINLRLGGTLSVYYDCLDALVAGGYCEKYHVTAFVHKTELFEKYKDYMTVIELPKAVGNYLLRIYYEYFYFYFYSRKREIDIWLSLHDMTPNVKARRRYTYCHNATPFAERNFKTLRFSPTVYFMMLFYKYLYRINIKKNDYVIVQQDWMREAFRKTYDIENVMVARPVSEENGPIYRKTPSMTAESRGMIDNPGVADSKRKDDAQNVSDRSGRSFIYASVARPFKNFEVICEACKILSARGVSDFQVIFTLDGTENSYSKWLKETYGDIGQIQWLGFVDREKLLSMYGDTAAMIFPSKLETWGLPVSEYRTTGKGIFLADLPYAHETVGTYDRVCFFDPNDSGQLADLMEKFLSGEQVFAPHIQEECKQPYAAGWKELLEKLIECF